MMDSDPIPCLICDEGHMVRATWLARPSFSCERADKVSKPEPMTLPDGTEVVVKTESEARALEKNFDGLRIHASPKENMQDAKRNRENNQKKLREEVKQSYINAAKDINLGG
jgi:hypothetical protein